MDIQIQMGPMCPAAKEAVASGVPSCEEGGRWGAPVRHPQTKRRACPSPCQVPRCVFLDLLGHSRETHPSINSLERKRLRKLYNELHVKSM